MVMAKGKKAREDLTLAAKSADTKMTHMTSIHNSVPRTTSEPGILLRILERKSAKYLKTNSNDFRIAVE